MTTALHETTHQLTQLKAALHEHRQALLASLLVSAWMVEARDPYTGGHLWRVAQFSTALAQLAGVDAAEAARIGIAGFLHDIGKIGIPDAILRKPGKLTDDEFDVIKSHPRVGAAMLAGHPLSPLVENAVHFHHEMPNGLGYPQQLSGSFIPFEARLVGICDAFDAMTSTRPYRAGMPINKALDIIEKNLSTQFDAELGQRFVQHGRQGAWDHIVGYTDEGIPLALCPTCGPILVRHRHTHAGDHVACPACNADFEWQNSASGLIPIATGKRASALQLDVTPDLSVINKLVQQWAKANTAV